MDEDNADIELVDDMELFSLSEQQRYVDQQAYYY